MHISVYTTPLRLPPPNLVSSIFPPLYNPRSPVRAAHAHMVQSHSLKHRLLRGGHTLDKSFPPHPTTAIKAIALSYG